MDYIRDYPQLFTALLGLIGAIASILILTSEQGRYRTKIKDLQDNRPISLGLQHTPAESKKTIDNEVQGVLDRLSETRLALTQQESSASRLRLASTTLTAGQYIVGLGLTSSFLQEQLSPNIIGILGLIVLISSTIQEHYRPAVQYRGAMERILRLKVLIRQVEDDLHSFKLGREDAPDMLELRRKISLALSDIDASEVRDLDTRLQPMGQPENPKE